jgi:hypothetical protein
MNVFKNLFLIFSKEFSFANFFVSKLLEIVFRKIVN